jgi:SAM-dependent methyltransferase
MKIHEELKCRSDVLNFVTNPKGVGIELGVAEGSFSEMILRATEATDFYLYSVDMWAGDRGHNVDEYRRTIVRLEPWKARNTILKMTFDDALPLFADSYFDFIYVDGYAHTGEEDGKYFRDWWPKLKPGGIMAGDDYHRDWPRVVAAVDAFSKEVSRELHLIPNETKVDKWSQYPSWFLIR